MQEAHVSQNPLEWGAEKIANTARRQADILSAPVARPRSLPVPRQIGVADLRAALREGYQDFLAFRSDVIFLCVLYPLAGIVLGDLTLGRHLFYLAFPLAAGFALLGPLFATGLYEMSRRRETSHAVTWATAFDAFRSPAIRSILGLGLGLVALFMAWVATAELIYDSTLGGRPPTIGIFLHQLFLTGPGLALIVVGIGVGFLFAVCALAISVVSFPLLLDRNVGVGPAVRMSLQVVRQNPRTMAIWGALVAALLVLGSLPLLIGLAVVLPVLGHATWHLYRRVVPVEG